MPLETIAPPQAQAPTPAPAPEPITAPSPEPAAPAAPPEEKFIEVDEAVLATLPPEVRQSIVDPLLTKAQAQVRDRITKEREESKPFRQKADALEKLIQNPAFQKWYYEQQNPAPKAPPAPGEVKPAVSAEEWAHAYDKAAQGDMTAINALQEKQLDLLVKQKYAPIIEHVQTKTRELEMTMELNDLFSNHADAKELDSIRVDPANPKSPSLLELALHYVSDKGGRSFEDAYQAAKTMADQLKAQAKNAALGLVQEKKNSITEPPARTTTVTEQVVEVATPQEALRNQIMASLRGSNVTYRVRPRSK